MALPRTIFGLSRSENILFYTWAFILVLYLFLYFLLPLCFLNSSNGLLNAQTVLISTISIFSGIILILVIFYRTSSCEAVSKKQEILREYFNNPKLYDNPYRVPKYLQNTIIRSSSAPGT